MKNLQRYLIINLVILLLYTVICKVTTKGSGGEEGLGYLIYMMLLVGAHVFINFVAAIVQFARGDRESGKALMLSAGATLVIGFSACLGGASI